MHRVIPSDRSLLPKCQSAGHLSSGIRNIILLLLLFSSRALDHSETVNLLGTRRRFNLNANKRFLNAAEINLEEFRKVSTSQLITFLQFENCYTYGSYSCLFQGTHLISRNTPSPPGKWWSIKRVPVVCVLLIIIKSKQLLKMKSVLSLSLFRASICKVTTAVMIYVDWQP